MLICEKEGFDDLLEAEGIPNRYDLALMSTKGISGTRRQRPRQRAGGAVLHVARHGQNGFIMAAGFPFATDLGIHMADVDQWGLAPEDQYHENPERTARTLRRNGATAEEAEFIANGQRVELNMFTSDQLVEYVEGKLKEHGLKKVIPDRRTLSQAWERVYMARRINDLIDHIYEQGAGELDVKEMQPMPDDMADQIREDLEKHPWFSWDEALWAIAGLELDDEDDDE